jgi:alpha-D-ribose 1-methylphosphonate 5-triphosphate diphosphatase PhnM
MHTVFKLAHDRVMPLHESIKLASTNAADVMGFSDRGRIAPGCAADLVLVDDRDNFPRVRGTLRAGTPIYWDSYLAVLTQIDQCFLPRLGILSSYS